MILVNKGGYSYWVPAGDKYANIGNYTRREQAFRIFMHVFTGKFPSRATELIQYNHIIQTASFTYAWENVYHYDREFRWHMERHPTRSWGVILQQAWTMFLKDQIGNNSQNPGKKFSGGQDPNWNVGTGKKICIDFNNGYCRFGNKCKFEHKCGTCSRYEHGTHNCRRAQAITANKKEKGQGTGGGGAPPSLASSQGMVQIAK